MEIDNLSRQDSTYGVEAEKIESLQQRNNELENQFIECKVQLQEQAQYDHLISKMALRIHQSRSLDETLNTTVTEVQELLECDRVIISQFLPDEINKVVTEAVVGGFPSILGCSFTAEVLPKNDYQIYYSRQTCVIADVENGDVPACWKQFLQKFAVKAFLVVPIFTQGELWGLMIAHHCCETRHWQVFEVDFLEQLATHIAIAIQQSQLYEQAQTELLERRKAQDLLEKSHSLLCAILDSTADGILVVDETGKILSFNQRLVDLWSIPESILELRDYKCVINFIKEKLKFPENFIRRFQAIDSQPNASSYDLLELQNGRYFTCYTKPQRLGEQIIGRAISFRDITEQKIAETALQKSHDLLETRVQERTTELSYTNEQLRHSKERFRNLVETSSDWIWEIDANQIYTYVCPKVYDILGYEPQEVLGKTFCELINWAEASDVHHSLSFLAETQQPFICIEYTATHKDGHLVFLESSGVPFFDFDADGQLLGYRGMNRDITKRRQAELEVRKALEREKQLNELKARFVAIASHEYRTPLSTILLSSDMLKHYNDKLNQNEKFKYLDKIQLAVANMTELLDDILLIQRSSDGRTEFNPVEFNLEKFCRDFLEEFSLSHGAHHTLKISVPEVDTLVVMDQKLLRQILNNLLSNAIKYSSKGSTVQFELFYDNQQAVFHIKDSGIGIPEADQQHLFDIFHRASNVGNVAGTGLGLAIVKNSVDLHGGKISVQSEVGIGTKFTVWIPLTAPLLEREERGGRIEGKRV
ncbi:MAG: ATP-binding protein [Crinalium sp.]